MALWAGLAIAFSPVLADLGEHWTEEPWARASLVFPWLVWIAARRDTVTPAPATWGRVLVASGIALELLAIGGNVVRLGRIGLAAAAIGLCLAAGWTSLRVALLFVWSVPLPAMLLNRSSPGLEMAVMGIGADLASIVGFHVVHTHEALEGPGGVLAVVPSDGGLATAFVLAGFGWFLAVWQRATIPGILRRAGCAALWSVPIHLTLAFGAAISLGIGLAPTTIRVWLSGFSWLGVTVLGLSGVWIASLRARHREGVRA